MANATFRHGEPLMIDYTPSAGDVEAGDIVVLGTIGTNTGGTGALACVAHRPIANNALGALACDQVSSNATDTAANMTDGESVHVMACLRM